jgi:ABC-type lipoprotein release transport system permease subunit
MTGVLPLLSIGWRNLWRNPRGTVLTALALGMGLALMLISLGLLDGGHEQAIADGVRLGSGHVVVQPERSPDSTSDERLLPRNVVTRITEMVHVSNDLHGVRGTSARLLATGLLSSSANATGVNVVGVSAQDERIVSLIPERMIEGTYLSDDAVPEVVIGADLARKLEARLGSRLVLAAQSLRQGDGESAEEPRSLLLRVRGIFRTGVRALDGGVIYLSAAVLRAPLGVADGDVTQVALLLNLEDDSPAVAHALRSELRGMPVEVLTWQESLPSLARMFGLDRAFNYVMNAVILVTVGLGILNTILMRVLERRYEFGVCKALGLRPWQIATMVVGESLALTAISVLLGLGLGLGVHHHFATSGLDLRSLFKAGLPPAFVLDPVLYSRLSEGRIVWAVGIVSLLSTILSVYPAVRAARTELPGALKTL